MPQEVRTKEHVIGRNFVPRGKLNGQWNLIVYACTSCNNIKSTLENDISAITMHPDASGEFHDSDECLKQEAIRKCTKSTSRLTGKPICKSIFKQTIHATLWDHVHFSVEYTGPPQVAPERVFELARLQLMALFYFISYNHASQIGGFWVGSMYPVIYTPRSDWGNPIHRSFMDSIIQWKSRLLTDTANGYYKAMIKRHQKLELWAWAVEWNKNFRVIGLFGQEEPAQAFVDSLAERKIHTLGQTQNHVYRIGIEEKLAPADDCLFTWNDSTVDSHSQ